MKSCEAAIRAALDVIDGQCNQKEVLHVSERTYDRLGWLGTIKDSLEDIIIRILDKCGTKINRMPIERRAVGVIKCTRGINVSLSTHQRFIAAAVVYKPDRSYKYRKDIKHEYIQFHADEILSRLLDCYELIPEVKQYVTLAQANANINQGEDISGHVNWRAHKYSGQKAAFHVTEDIYKRLIILRMDEYSFTTVLEMLLDCYEQRPEIKNQIRFAHAIKEGNITIRERSSLSSKNKPPIVNIHIEVHERLIWLSTSKDTINNVVKRLLDVCEKRVFEELKRRLSVRRSYDTLVDVMKRERLRKAGVKI